MRRNPDMSTIPHQPLTDDAFSALLIKQVKLWFYKLPPAGLAAVRKIQNGTIFAEKTSLNIQNRTKFSTQPCSRMVKKVQQKKLTQFLI